MTKKVKKKAVVKKKPHHLGRKTKEFEINTFILGDLLIDHTVFVDKKQTTYPAPVPGEQAFEVKRRLDTAGGAGTTARTVNNLSKGTTFLWGLVGDSPWGKFRAILDNSQTLDGATRRIEFRGAHDETDAPMTTITRLVSVDNTEDDRERYIRRSRFTDYGQLHISVKKQVDAMTYHLNRVHKDKAPIDAIVLNDLDMGALKHEVVEAISKFAFSNKIRIIIRVRRNAQKYYNVHASALVCTLSEWNKLVTTNESMGYWAKNLHRDEVAHEFARCTLGAFKNTNHFVILVGDDWIDSIILIERLGENYNTCQLVRTDGLPIEDRGKSQQLGASDVFTGALAIGLCNYEEESSAFRIAVDEAMQVVRFYQKASWNRIPQGDLLGNQKDSFYVAQQNYNIITSRPVGTPFLPSNTTIDMELAKTCITNLYSVIPEFKETLSQLLLNVEEGDKSIVIAAPGGSGKSEISKHIVASGKKIEAQFFSNLKIDWNWNRPQETLQQIKNAYKGLPTQNPFIVVDEALKLKGHKYIATKGVIFLNEAEKAGIRFLFIDADFAKFNFDKLKSQFARRVEWYNLPSAWERPYDIPYVFASCLRKSVDIQEAKFSIDISALNAIIEWMLNERQNFGTLNDLAKKIVPKQNRNNLISIIWDSLPKQLKTKYKPYQEGLDKVYSVKFDNNGTNSGGPRKT